MNKVRLSNADNETITATAMVPKIIFNNTDMMQVKHPIEKH